MAENGTWNPLHTCELHDEFCGVIRRFLVPVWAFRCEELLQFLQKDRCSSMYRVQTCSSRPPCTVFIVSDRIPERKPLGIDMMLSLAQPVSCSFECHLESLVDYFVHTLIKNLPIESLPRGRALINRVSIEFARSSFSTSVPWLTASASLLSSLSSF